MRPRDPKLDHYNLLQFFVLHRPFDVSTPWEAEEVYHTGPGMGRQDGLKLQIPSLDMDEHTPRFNGV